jgi:hypothetical protein
MEMVALIIFSFLLILNVLFFILNISLVNDIKKIQERENKAYNELLEFYKKADEFKGYYKDEKTTK